MNSESIRKPLIMHQQEVGSDCRRQTDYVLSSNREAHKSDANLLPTHMFVTQPVIHMTVHKYRLRNPEPTNNREGSLG